MGAALVIIGIGCVIAAIVGGGIKLQQLEVGQVTSLWRQSMLGVFGSLVSAFGFAIDRDYFSTPNIAFPAPIQTSNDIRRPIERKTEQASTDSAATTGPGALATAAESVGTVSAKAAPSDFKLAPPLLAPQSALQDSTETNQRTIDTATSFNNKPLYYSCDGFATILVNREIGLIFDGQIPIYIAEAVHGFWMHYPDTGFVTRYHLDTVSRKLYSKAVNLSDSEYKSLQQDVLSRLSSAGLSPKGIEFGRQYVASMDQIMADKLSQLKMENINSVSCEVKSEL